MYSYNYTTVITLPLNDDEKFEFESTNLEELADKLNYFYLERTGLDGLFNRDKLQNYIQGRSKLPTYLRNVKIIRS